MNHDRSVTVLVLGVGGNVSQGILKALAASALRWRVVAGCVSPLSLGLYRADSSYVSPLADDPEFMAWTVDVCRRENVDVVLSGVEPVLRVLSEHATELHDSTGAVAVVSSPEVLAVGQDKLITSEWLRGRGLPFARSVDAADPGAVQALAAECGLPLIAKPRQGKGAHGVVVIEHEDQLAPFAGRPGFMVQEMLGDPSSEFTAGCVCDRGGVPKGTLVMRRELAAGTTVRAEAGEFPAVRDVAERIARELGPTGPLNVQLRMTKSGPVPFELNVRFSGTAPARARLGFNEVEAVVRHLLFDEQIDLPRVTEGIVLRYWNEAYVRSAARDTLASTGHLDDPDGSGAWFEDWGVKG